MQRILLGTLLTTILLANEQFIWQPNGIAIRQGVHIEWQRTGDVGNSGEMIIGWSDTRNGNRDVYLQKFDTDGNRLWGETGVQVSNAPGRQEDPVLVSDGLGGAFLAWIDYRSDEYGDVYAQYITSDGSVQWDLAGVPVAVNDGAQQTVNMARGPAGFAAVIWDDQSLSEQGDIFGTILSTSGPLAAGGTNGLPVVSANGTQSSHSIETSGDAVVVVWRDTRDSGDPDIYGQRLDMDFNKAWGTDGVVICDAAGDQKYPKVAPADGERVAVSWLDPRNNIKNDVYSQLVDAGGNPAWVLDGVAITADAAEQRGSRVKSDGTGLIYYVWEDFRNNNQDPDIYSQAVDFSGTTAWTDGGVPVVTATLKQLQPRLTLNDAGGIFVTWLDERNGGFPESDIYLQSLSSTGAAVFQVDGLALTDSMRYQTGGLVRPDGSGGAFVVWGNASTGSIGIMAQHVNSSGSVTWDADGQEFFYGIDGDARDTQVLPWDTDKVLVFWEDHRRAASGATATAQVLLRDGSTVHTYNGVSLSTNQEQSDPAIAADGSGGAYLGFLNKTSGVENLYAHRVDTNLGSLWPGDGIRVYDGNWGAQKNPLPMAADDGSLYYFFSEERLGPFTIYVQRYDGDGNTQWTPEGVGIAEDMLTRDKYARFAFPAENNSVIFVWEAISWDDVDIYISRLEQDGSLSWSYPVTENPGFQARPMAFQDAESGDIILGWEDSRNAAVSGVDLYSNRIHPDGTFAAEFIISDATGDQTALALSPAADGSGAIYAAWEDYRDGVQHDIFVREISLPAAEEQITTEGSEDLDPALQALTADRFLVAWEDFRNGIHSDLYFYDSKPDVDGHADGGVPLSLAVLNQTDPIIKPYADSELDSMAYLIVWLDMRASGKTELTNIYGQVYATPSSNRTAPVLASDFRVGPAYPNPFNGGVNVPVQVLQQEEVKLYIYDLRGREIHRSRSVMAGRQVLHWNGRDQTTGKTAHSGVYLVRVVSPTGSVEQKLLLLK